MQWIWIWIRTIENTVADHVVATVSVGKALKHESGKQQRLKTFQELTRLKVLSAGMAAKAADSGFTAQHLTLAHSRDPFAGIQNLLSEKTPAGRRVTATKIVLAVKDHFASIQ